MDPSKGNDGDMKHDLWYSESERSGVLLHERDAPSIGLKWPDARVIWTVDTETYAIAAAACAAVLHWGNRESGGPQATVRLTRASYLDRQGEQCDVVVPGWVGRIPAPLPGAEDVYLGLLDHLDPVVPHDRGKILGYVYIERPGCVAFDGPALVIQAKRPETLTVVTLLCADGSEAMFQEFDGRFGDSREINRMVDERLGSEMSDWTITRVQVIGHQKHQREKVVSEPAGQRVATVQRGDISAKGPPDDTNKYAGCRLFTSSAGLTGFALGAEGETTGWLYDFFASPREEERTVHEMLALAIQQGARMLVTYRHPLVANFFMRFGFQPTSIVNIPDLKKAPPGWVPEACMSETDPISCPGFLYMILVNPAHRVALRAEDLDAALRVDQRTSKAESTIVSHAPCTSCGRAVANRTSAYGVFEGYECPHCGFIHVCGTLTLGPPRPSRARDPGTSDASPREQACPCGSGRAFVECHGSE